MLRELVPTRQVPGEPVRRWFSSDDVDLIVWCDGDGVPTAFQLCYRVGLSERALTWTPEAGFVHRAVDDGEEDAGLRYKATPILVADGEFDPDRVGALVSAQGAALPPAILEFVTAKLAEHPARARRA